MMRRRKSNAERNRAKYLRNKRKHSKLSRAEQSWLDEYEGETARWEAAEDVAPRAARAPSSSSAPLHTAEPVAGGGPERFAALPVLPPAAAAESPPNVPTGGAPPGQSGDTAPPPGMLGDAPAPGVEEPLFEAPPPPAADPALLAAAAARFATLVVAVNAFGLKALLELFPPGSVPLPEGMDALARDPKAHAGVLELIRASAIELAQRHPWLCAVGPSPAAIVLGSTSVSLTAVYYRHFKRRDEEQPTGDAVEVGPAPPPSAANGVRRRAPPAPRGDTLDFRQVFGDA